MFSGLVPECSIEPAHKVRSSRYDREWVNEIQLTSTDLAYLEILFRDGPTRVPMLHARVGNGLTSDQYVVRRLRLLHGRPQAYVDRPRVQKRMFWDSPRREHINSHHLIYTINQKGVDLLRTRGVLVDSEIEEWKQVHNRHQHKQFPHEVLIADVLNSIKLGLKTCPGTAFYSAGHILHKATGTSTSHFIVPRIQHPSNLTACSNVKLYPDALFTLEVPDAAERYRLYALEADTGTMPITFHNFSRSSILKKVLCYREIISKGLYMQQFNMKQPMLCLIVTKAARISAIAQSIRQLAAGEAWARAFWFRDSKSSAGDPMPAGSFVSEWRDIDGRRRYLCM